MFKSWFHRVIHLTSILAILPHAFSAIGQCYSFTGASTTGVPAAIYLSLPSLQSPTVGTDPAGDTTFTYSLGGSGGNSVTVSGGGVTSTASGTAITPGAASQIVVTSGPALTAVQIQVSSSTGDPYPFAATIGLSTPEGANLPVNFLPNGITDPLPPLSSWTQTGAYIDIASTTPVVFDALVTGIGSDCSSSPPKANDCSRLFTVTPGNMKVEFNRTLPFFSIQGIDYPLPKHPEPYLYVYSGQFKNGSYGVPYAARIDPTAGLIYGASSNQGELPEIVIAQNLIIWSGSAHYSGDDNPEYNAAIYTLTGNPPNPPYQIMDAVGGTKNGSNPLFLVSSLDGSSNSSFLDTPDIHVPITDENGELQKIDYAKYFTAYIGCTYPSNPIASFKTLAIVDWHVVFSGTIKTELRGDPPSRQSVFIPDSSAGVYGSQARAPQIGEHPTLSLPAANCVTSYVNFHNEIAGPLCKSLTQ